MRRVSEGIQAQAPPDRAQAAPHRREAVPMQQVLQEVLALGLLQPAHEPSFRHLQTLQRLKSIGGVFWYDIKSLLYDNSKTFRPKVTMKDTVSSAASDATQLYLRVLLKERFSLA